MACLQRLPELPFRIPAAALQRAASQAISMAESLRAPEGALSKQGSAGGHRIIGTKQATQKVSVSSDVCSLRICDCSYNASIGGLLPLSDDLFLMRLAICSYIASLNLQVCELLA